MSFVSPPEWGNWTGYWAGARCAVLWCWWAAPPGSENPRSCSRSADNLCQTSSVLYVSGEESERQIKLRAERLGVKGERLYLYSQTNLDDIVESVRELSPDVLIIDSIQTLYNGENASPPAAWPRSRTAP